MKLATRVMDCTLAYRLLQAPFAEQKFAPILAHNDLRAVRRVLDVACGPGTNTPHFAQTDYLGIDYNPHYIESARRRHRRRFLVADVTSDPIAAEQRFDFILANSFLHHVDTASARRILSHLGGLLTPDGHVHILDLVLPERFGAAQLLARWDRGDFPRPLDGWYHLCTAGFEPVVFEPYAITALGVTLWNMVYFKGRSHR